MLTGLPGEPPEDEEPDVALDRVVTGFAVEPGLPDAACDALVRVATGAGAALTNGCEPLERVIGAAVTPGPVAPRAWERLVLVVTGTPACRAAGALAREGRGSAARWWRVTWIVRRITSVRTSTAGLRAASVAVVSEGGRIANAAKATAASAVTAATIRVCLVRMLEPPVRGTAPLCTSDSHGDPNVR